MLDQLHSAIFQVDEADPHPPQQLQMFRVVCHEVLSPEGRTAHARLPERRNKKRRMLKTAVRGGGGVQLCHLLIAENIQNIPVGSRAGATLVNSTTDRFSQVPRKGRVRKEEACVWACPIEVGVIQFLIRLEYC